MSELSTMSCPSWVALHSTAHSFIKLHKTEKIRDTKGTFHAKMGTIKDRSGVDQRQKISKRGGRNTQKSCKKKKKKKDLNDLDNHVGVITHLEPDILECEVK